LRAIARAKRRIKKKLKRHYKLDVKGTNVEWLGRELIFIPFFFLLYFERRENRDVFDRIIKKYIDIFLKPKFVT
jgi:hypothetical protein